MGASGCSSSLTHSWHWEMQGVLGGAGWVNTGVLQMCIPEWLILYRVRCSLCVQSQ